MEWRQMLQQELIDLDVDVSGVEELFEVIAERLRRRRYVNNGYLDGLKERERVFPTGLLTEFLAIALPHSDVEYIEKPFIYIVRTTKPVRVKQMGDNQEMDVRSFFFLGIKEPDKQVGLLQELMFLFQNQQFVEQLIEITEPSEMYHLFNKQWEEVKHG